MSNISYLRFTILNNISDPSITNLTEFTLVTTDNRYLSLNRFINPSFTTSNPLPNPSYPIENLFDGSLSYTQWNTNGRIVITVQFDTPWSISEYPNYALYINNGEIYSSYPSITNPNSFIVELSQDNINWTNYSNITNAIYNDATGNGSYTNFSFESICVGPDTKILLHDGTSKMISELKRGDRIIQDVQTGKTGKIARIIVSSSVSRVKIPIGLLGNKEELIITEGHPVWINDDNNRIYAKNIKGSKKIQGRYDVYSIQFEEEGTFYAESIRVDSLSTNFYKFKLPKELFFNKAKHDKRCVIREEDDPRRGKPLMLY